MDIELLDRHEREWEEHFRQYREGLQKLMEAEQAIRQTHGYSDGSLPKDWRNKVQTGRKAWSEEWGVKGSRVTAILDRHKKEAEVEEQRLLQELERGQPASSPEKDPDHDRMIAYAISQGYRLAGYSEAEMEAMHEEYLRDEQEQQADKKDFEASIQRQILEYEQSGQMTLTGEEFLAYLTERAPSSQPEHKAAPAESPPLPGRYTVSGRYQRWDKAWQALTSEHAAVRDYYDTRDKPVPGPTDRRMARQSALFKNQWEGIEAEPELESWRTLDDEDLQQETQSWCNLMEHHEIIEHHYGRPEAVPDAARNRMAAEVTVYWKEVEAWQQRQKVDQEPPVQTNSQSFREQLEILRQRPRSSMRPKGPG